MPRGVVAAAGSTTTSRAGDCASRSRGAIAWRAVLRRRWSSARPNAMSRSATCTVTEPVPAPQSTAVSFAPAGSSGMGSRMSSWSCICTSMPNVVNRRGESLTPPPATATFMSIWPSRSPATPNRATSPVGVMTRRAGSRNRRDHWSTDRCSMVAVASRARARRRGGRPGRMPTSCAATPIEARRRPAKATAPTRARTVPRRPLRSDSHDGRIARDTSCSTSVDAMADVSPSTPLATASPITAPLRQLGREFW